MIVDVLLKEQTHSKEERAPGRATGVKDRFLKVRETKISLGSIAPCTCKYAISSFTVNPRRRQQENITFIRDNDCNSVALTLSRAAQIARAQALGSCPLHTTENIKNIQILSRTKKTVVTGSGTATPRSLRCLPACLDCSEVQEKIVWHIFVS